MRKVPINWEIVLWLLCGVGLMLAFGITAPWSAATKIEASHALSDRVSRASMGLEQEPLRSIAVTFANRKQARLR